MIDLNEIAKSEGYDFAKNTGAVKDGYKIYALDCERHACIGLPIFILVKGEEVKVVGGIEGYELHCWLCDNYPDDDDEDTEE